MKSPGTYGKRFVSLIPVMLLWAAVWGASAPAFAQGLDTWTCKGGSINHNWSNMLNWDNGVPTAASDVRITNACESIVDKDFSISNLEIRAGGEVIVGGGSSLTINGTSIANDGQLFLRATTFGAAELLIARTVILSGNGRLVMSASADNVIGGDGTLFNESTIEGGGRFQSDLTLENFGTINANNAVPLIVSNGMTNAGTLESTGNGELALGGSYKNAGGTIGGNNVRLSGGTSISGGTLSAGTITASGGEPVLLDGVTLAPGCQYILPSDSQTIIDGTITNNGQIKLNNLDPDGVSTTKLTVIVTATVNGSGVITSSDRINNQITGLGQPSTLNIGPQQTLENGMLIIVSELNNQNLIRGGFHMIFQDGRVTNTGTITTGGAGGMIDFLGVRITNTGGSISADNGLITMDGQEMTVGGTVTTSGAGVVRLKSATLDGSASPVRIAGFAEALQNDVVTLQAIIDFDDAARLDVQGGTVHVKTDTTLRRTPRFGAVTPTTGTIIMSSNPNNVIQGIDGTEVLTNNITIQGAGNIGNGRLGLVNGTNGQIIASSSSVPLVIAMGPSNVFINDGLVAFL